MRVCVRARARGGRASERVQCVGARAHVCNVHMHVSRGGDKSDSVAMVSSIVLLVRDSV